MSYILNALKKAERDRLREDPKELDDFASANWDPYQQSPSSNRLRSSLIIGTIIALSIAVGAIGVAYFSTHLSTMESAAIEPAIPDSTATTPEPANIQPIDVIEASKPPQRSKAELPVLSISGHMYFAEGSPSNRLFANNQSYRENDSIAEGWVLAKIGVDGIEIRSGERTAFLPYP
jgi:hypothetical protein